MDRYRPAAVYENILEMFKYRGIKHTGDKYNDQRVSEELNQYEIMIVPGRYAADTNRDGDMCVIIMAPDSKYAHKTPEFDKLRKHYAGMSNVIFVSDYGLSSNIRKRIKNIYPNSFPAVYFEQYDYDMFICNKMIHPIVPKHEIAPADELEGLARDFLFNPRKTDQILATDPGAVWIGARPGDIVKITRVSETAGWAIAYRLCIAPQ